MVRIISDIKYKNKTNFKKALKKIHGKTYLGIIDRGKGKADVILSNRKKRGKK